MTNPTYCWQQDSASLNVQMDGKMEHTMDSLKTIIGPRDVFIGCVFIVFIVASVCSELCSTEFNLGK